MRSSRAPQFFAVLAVVAFGSIACRRSAAREWRPEDHDQEQATQGLQPAGSDGGANPQVQTESDVTLAQAAWSANCTACHGRAGQGDGPQGPMVKAPNLTDPDFMKQFTDDQLVAVIKSGKGKMPAFPSMPDRVVRAVVALVRSRLPPQ